MGAAERPRIANTTTLSGDFTRQAKLDPAFPDAQSWFELKRYLIRAGAHKEIFPAAHKVWHSYRAKLRLALDEDDNLDTP